METVASVYGIGVVVSLIAAYLFGQEDASWPIAVFWPLVVGLLAYGLVRSAITRLKGKDHE